MNKRRIEKMPFWKLAHGKMAQDVQELFEKAQKVAINRNLACKVKLIIEVRPPDPSDPYYGNIRYQTDFTEPAHVSKQYQTILHNGIIIDNPELGAPQLDLLIHKDEESEEPLEEDEVSDADFIEPIEEESFE